VTHEGRSRKTKRGLRIFLDETSANDAVLSTRGEFEFVNVRRFVPHHADRNRTLDGRDHYVYRFTGDGFIFLSRTSYEHTMIGTRRTDEPGPSTGIDRKTFENADGIATRRTVSV